MREASTRSVGNIGEGRAVAFLEEKGLRILGRQFHARVGEIDIIARDGEWVVFVEVKFRQNDRFGLAVESITPQKFLRMQKAALFWLIKAGIGEEAPYRFDVVAIDGEKVEWLQGISL